MATRFRSLDTLARFTAAGLGLSGLVALLEAVAWLVSLLTGGAVGWALAGTEAPVDPSAVLSLFTAVVFLVWLSRARSNVASFGERYQGIHPVAAWFVPVGNLWLPYTVVTEIWHRSRPARTAATIEPTPWYVHAWWGCWVGSIIVPLGAVVFGLPVFTVLGKALRVLAAGYAIAVVLGLSARQRRRHAGAGPSTF